MKRTALLVSGLALALGLAGKAVAKNAAPPRPPVAPASGYAGLGAESVTSAQVAKFAAPPLPEGVARRIQTYLDVRGAAAGVITSKGDRLLFTSRVTGQYQVWRQDGPMGFAVQLTGGEDRTSVIELAPNDQFAVVSRDVGGQENPGLYLLPLDGGALTVVQHTPKVQTFLEYVSADSKSVYFRANDVDPASFALYRYDLASKQKARLFDQPGLWQIADRRGDREWILERSLGNTQNEIWLFDVATKALTPLLGQGKLEEYDVRFGAQPGTFVVRSNEASEHYRLYEYRIATKAMKAITPEVPYDIETFTLDEPRTRIYHGTNEKGYARTHVLDSKTYQPIAMPKLPAADNVRFAGSSRSGRFVSLTIDGPQMPSRTLMLDWRTRKLTTWQVPMTPEVDVTTFAALTLESFPARDGTAIPMFVRRSPRCPAPGAAGVPCPVIVEFHGGPEGQARAGFSALAQLYVDAGFILVQPNVRGSTGYGKKWLHADDAARRLDVVTDIEDVAKHIRATWTAGGKAPKLGIMGGSYGGYSALMGMSYFAGAYDAGVQVVGISNLKTFLMNTAPYRRILRISEYGDPVQDAEALTKLSPITHVGKIRAPLLSIQGVNDPRVPVGEALQIYRELERRKIPGGLILFPDEGHGVAKRANQVLSTGHTLAFFEKYLR